MMKQNVTITTKIEPFEVPETVSSVADENGPMYYYPISGLSESDLERLCDQFTKAVFKAAGKEMPPLPGPSCPDCGKRL